jgi:hypothetical protein
MADRDVKYALHLDYSDFERGIESAHGEWEKFTEALTTGLGLGGGFALGEKIAEGILSIGEAAFESVSRLGELGEHMEQLSRQTGASTEELQHFAYAGKLAGIDLDTMSLGVAKMQKSIVAGSEAFGQLGLSTQFLRTLSTEAAFDTIISKIGQIGDASGRTAAAIEIFGKSGAQFLRLDEGLAETDAQFQRLGLGLSGPTMEAAAQFERQIKSLEASFDNLKLQMAATLVETGLAQTAVGATQGFITSLNKAVSEASPMWASWAKEGIDLVANGLINLVRNAGPGLTLLFEAMEKAQNFNLTGAMNSLKEMANLKFTYTDFGAAAGGGGGGEGGDAAFRGKAELEAAKRAAQQEEQAWKEANREIVADLNARTREAQVLYKKESDAALQETERILKYEAAVSTKYKELQDQQTLANKTGLDRRLAQVEIAHQKELDGVAKLTAGQDADYARLAGLVDAKYQDMAHSAIESQVQQMNAATKGELTQVQRAEEARDQIVEAFAEIASAGSASYDQIARAAEAAARAQKHLDEEVKKTKLEHFKAIESSAAQSLTKLFGHSKAAATASAVADLGAAMIATWKNSGGWPWAIVPVAMMAAAGAVEIGKIKGAHFATGTRGLGVQDFGAGTEAVLHGREAVIPENRIQDFKAMLQGDQTPILLRIAGGIEKLVAVSANGGGAAGGGVTDPGQALLAYMKSGRLRIPKSAIVDY